MAGADAYSSAGNGDGCRLQLVSSPQICSNQGMFRDLKPMLRWTTGVCLVAGAMLSSAAHARPPIVPQAMLDACAAHKEGEPCRFEMSSKVIEGLCAPLPDAQLACRPGGKAKAPKAGTQAPPKAPKE